jgi:hypothetical protein
MENDLYKALFTERKHQQGKKVINYILYVLNTTQTEYFVQI